MQPVQHARKGDGLADVFQPADPGHRALDAHPEAAVRCGAVLAQIDLPLEGFPRQVVLLDALPAARPMWRRAWELPGPGAFVGSNAVRRLPADSHFPRASLLALSEDNAAPALHPRLPARPGRPARQHRPLGRGWPPAARGEGRGTDRLPFVPAARPHDPAHCKSDQRGHLAWADRRTDRHRASPNQDQAARRRQGAIRAISCFGLEKAGWGERGLGGVRSEVGLRPRGSGYQLRVRTAGPLTSHRRRQVAAHSAVARPGQSFNSAYYRRM